MALPSILPIVRRHLLLALGGGALAGSVAPVEIKKSVRTHCAVGCTVTAEVSNGIWIGQEPSSESPINRGGALRQPPRRFSV